jgi:hypothetical protein
MLEYSYHNENQISGNLINPQIHNISIQKQKIKKKIIYMEDSFLLRFENYFSYKLLTLEENVVCLHNLTNQPSQKL